MATRKAPAKHSTEGRELIDTGTSKRYVRRGANGQFTSGQILVGRSRKAPKGPSKRSDRRSR